MTLNTNVKVKLPNSKWVLSKPNKNGTRYVRYLISYTRVSSNKVIIKRFNIGIYDEDSNMLIPNNYYKIFGESFSSYFTPSSIRNYVNYYLLYRINSDIGLLDTVKKVFPSSWDKIMTITMYNICENDAMYYIDDYCDENFTMNNSYINSPETSGIFSKITETQKQNFYKEWIKTRSDNECIAYDITSISSYSKKISLSDYGYNRDGENLPQINLGMLYGMNSNLPLLYDIYNGSIGDKVHFESMLKYAHSFNLNNASLVMDRGFFKKDNLIYLYKNSIPFIMGVSLSIKEVKELFVKFKNKIKSSEYTIHDKENNLTSGASFDI